MALINWYRQGQKRMLLQRVLSHSLAATLRIYPRFGSPLFFEHPVTNPFGHEERFLIEVDDSELRIVSNFEEWLLLREQCASSIGELGPKPIEPELFDHDGKGNILVALLPHETLHIPFVFLSMKPYRQHGAVNPNRGNSRSNVALRAESKEESKESMQFDNHDEEPSRQVEVKIISCTHGHVCAVLKIGVFPRPFVVNRVFRFFEPENTIMKRRVELRQSLKPMHLGGFTNTASKYVHCVEHNFDGEAKVMIEWADSGAGNLELLLRYRCGSFPDAGDFYLIIYNDPYQCSLYEIWHVVVQSRQSIFLHSSVGGSSTIDLVVRGDRFTRRAKAYSSQSLDRVEFSPDNIFQLIPGAYNKVALRYHPKQTGMRRVQLNLVDVDSRELISAWLLTVSTTSPPVMRRYDVEVPEGTDVHKKILFKNPWNVPRKFFLTSSDENVMKPRVEVLDVAPHGNSYLRLWFSKKRDEILIGGSQEVYLFLNNDEGQNEESFLFQVKYL